MPTSRVRIANPQARNAALRANWYAPEFDDRNRIRFPAEFQRVLVVAYRPAQFWVEAQGLSPAIPF